VIDIYHNGFLGGERVLKKLLSLVTVFMLVFMTSASALAGANDLHSKSLKKNAAIVKQIAAGEDYLVGGGVPFDGSTESQGDFSIQWASGGVNHTHQYLTSRALTTLKNDKGDTTADLLIKYAGILLSNSDWPDSYEKDFGLYLGHFYNPVTGRTLFGLSKPTAMTRFLEHTQKAATYYAKNKNVSMQELGRALHYLADINTPHHAALLTALNSNHTAFERLVDSTRLDYSVDTTDKYSGITSVDATRDLKGYSQEIFTLSARHALEYRTQATSPYVEDMLIAAKATMEYSQEIMAAYLFNFLRAVKAVK
jgi:phospholipase C